MSKPAPAAKISTKVSWHEIAIVGMPPREFHVKDNGALRVFLCRGEWSVFTAYPFDDSSGFDAGPDVSDTAIAWAIIDGF